jgi:hypothetical protein
MEVTKSKKPTQGAKRRTEARENTFCFDSELVGAIESELHPPIF